MEGINGWSLVTTPFARQEMYSRDILWALEKIIEFKSFSTTKYFLAEETFIHWQYIVRICPNDNQNVQIVYCSGFTVVKGEIHLYTGQWKHIASFVWDSQKKTVLTAIWWQTRKTLHSHPGAHNQFCFALPWKLKIRTALFSLLDTTTTVIFAFSAREYWSIPLTFSVVAWKRRLIYGELFNTKSINSLILLIRLIFS